jgi:hypothetical protein
LGKKKENGKLIKKRLEIKLIINSKKFISLNRVSARFFIDFSIKFKFYK